MNSIGIQPRCNQSKSMNRCVALAWIVFAARSRVLSAIWTGAQFMFRAGENGFHALHELHYGMGTGMGTGTGTGTNLKSESERRVLLCGSLEVHCRRIGTRALLWHGSRTIFMMRFDKC